MAEQPEFNMGSKGKSSPVVDTFLDKKFRGSRMDRYFKVSDRGSNLMTEIRAGITTFLTAAYIMAVNPNIISTTGLNFEGLVFATAASSCVATLIMALWANLPFGLWPGMWGTVGWSLSERIISTDPPLKDPLDLLSLPVF